MKTMNASLVLLALGLVIGCGKKEKETNASFDEKSASLETMVNSLSATADDLGESSSSFSAQSVGTAEVQSSSVFCQRAIAASCVPNGALSSKSQTYQGCVIPYTAVTAAGSVSLSFNNGSCSISNTGDQVARSYEVTFTGYYGFTHRVSSENHSNYEGVSLGGGGQALRTANGWELNLNGQHRVVSSPKGVELANVSLRTTQPILITGTLSKVNRVVNSGELEVAHNKLGMTAKYRPSNLRYDSTCCYPISGSLTVDYSGNSENRSANVAITGCGTAQITWDDGKVESKTFHYCE